MCTPEHHAHLVAHEWNRLIPIGTSFGCESANCPDCPEGHRFTFSRALPVSKFWLCKRDHVVRVEHSDGHMTVYNLQDGCIPDFDDEEFARSVWDAWDGDGDERYQGTDASEAKAWDACERHNESQEAA